MKRFKHIFTGHKWGKPKDGGSDYSEPHEKHYPGEIGDYLPTSWKEWKCSCGAKKRIYHDILTHLGTEPDRLFIYFGDYVEIKNYKGYVASHKQQSKI